MNEPVLIAGAGPAGLVAAITLARQGIASLLVERRAGVSPFPRATAISTRTMELIRSWGLEDRVRAGEIDARAEGWLCETLASPNGMAVPMGFPSRAQALAASPTAPALVPQDHLEPVLLEHLRRYPCADIRFGVELVTLSQDDDGATAVLRDIASGRCTTVRCGYVIGADGAHSTVRATLGIDLRGPGNLGDFLAVMFRAPVDKVVGDRRYGIYLVGQSLFLPTDNRDRWLYCQPSLPDRPAERLLELIHASAGVPDLPVEILRVSTFTFAAQIADRYRDRRVFLAGDAAHRITPRGGTGMNTAVHDAYDLAWKLGWVLNRWASPGLLDSYETERRPVGVRNTTNSIHGVRDNVAAFADDLGGRLPHLWQKQGRNLVSTLDLLGPGLTLLTGPDGTPWQDAAATSETPLPLAVHGVDAAAAAAFGVSTGGAVLVRPDGQPIHRWHSATSEPRQSLQSAVVAASDVRVPVKSGQSSNPLCTRKTSIVTAV